MSPRSACRVWVLLAVVLASGWLGACASKTAMMPAPLAIRQAGRGVFDRVPESRRGGEVEVFYATDRARLADGRAGARYGSARGAGVRLGSARVRVGPEEWSWDDLTERTLDGARPRLTVTGVFEFGAIDDGAPATDASLSSGGPPDSPAMRFADSINAALDRAGKREVFVYVPGFNLTFELGLRRMAEFSHYLGREGVFVAFAWPAHSHPFAYRADRRSAFRSAEEFGDFLALLTEQTRAERIHLIASSAGAPVVSGALAALREANPGLSREALRARSRIGLVVYAASDQDADEFREMLRSGAFDAAEHVTVYASGSDAGLLLTSNFGSGDRTIGRLPASLTEEDASALVEFRDLVSVVDVTPAVDAAGRGDMWAHRYWYLNTWVSSDLITLLRHGTPPEGRALVPTEGGALWAFPPDYPGRLREAMAGCAVGDSLRPAAGAPVE